MSSSDHEDIEARRGIKAVETGGRLLEALCGAGRAQDLGELARKADMSSSQAHAYLLSFQRVGLARRDPASKRYALGGLAREMGLAELRSLDPVGMALDAVEDLRRAVRLTVALAVWGSHGPTVIRVHPGETPLHSTLYEGANLSIDTTATGLAFVAFRDADSSYARRLGRIESTVAVQLQAARARGYSRQVDSPIPGLLALSAPVFNHDGTMVCAVTIVGEHHGAAQWESAAAAQLLLTTRRLSARLGYRPDIARDGLADDDVSPCSAGSEDDRDIGLGKGVQSIEVGARLLHALCRQGRAMTLREICRDADLPAAKAHPYLVSFCKLQLVEQNRLSGSYQLGALALRLGMAELSQSPILRSAAAALRELTLATGLTAALSVWSQHGPTLTHLVVGQRRPVEANLRVGFPMNLASTATGRVFAAYLPDKAAPLLDRLADHQAVDREELVHALDQIRRRGMERAQGSPVPGVNALCVPIFNASSSLEAVMMVMGRADQLDARWDGSVAQTLRERCARLALPACADAAAPHAATPRRGPAAP